MGETRSGELGMKKETNKIRCPRKQPCELGLEGNCTGPATLKLCTTRKIPGERLKLLLDIHRCLQKYQAEIENINVDYRGIPWAVASAQDMIFKQLQNLVTIKYFEQTTVESMKRLFSKWRYSESGQRALNKKSLLSYYKGRDDPYRIFLLLLVSYMREKNHNKPNRKDLLHFIDEHKVRDQSNDSDLGEKLGRRYNRLEKDSTIIAEQFEQYRTMSYVGARNGTYSELYPHIWTELAIFELPIWKSISSVNSEPCYEVPIHHPIEHNEWILEESLTENPFW